MTPDEAVFKIKQSLKGPIRGNRWSIRLWKRWRKQAIAFKGIRGIRIPEYESILVKDFDCCFWYATEIVRGKLPKKMHNFMISHGISDPNNGFVRIYLEMIERLEKSD